MIKKIKIYSPCDGNVFPIEQLNDGVFSEKILGDGFYIIPSSNTFYSPLNDASLEVLTETKHAYYLKDNNILENSPLVLMHIGLDTVKLGGAPFEMLVKLNEKVNKNSKIVKVDLDLIQQNNFDTATPIVLDPSSQNWKFIFNNTNQEVKQGDEIGYLVFDEITKDESVQESNDNKPIINQLEGINFVNKYDDIAQKIYLAIGGVSNYTNYSNCMTRFRIDIINKEIVDIEVLKKLSVVKGINWLGEELQIIIGGEVSKVVDAFVKYTNNLEKNNQPSPKSEKNNNSSESVIPLTKKILGTITGIITPIIPVLMIVALLKSIYVILSLPSIGVLDDVQGSLGGGADSLKNHVNWFSYVFFVIGDLPILFIGCFFCVSTVKFMKGNILVGFVISLILSAPLIYSNIYPYDYSNVLGWKWFDLPGFTIPGSAITKESVLQPMAIGIVNFSQNIFVMLAAGACYVFVDRWIKRWMPSMVDIIFRTPLAVFITILATYGVFGIAMSFIQYILAIIIIILQVIPFGIGIALFAIFWQPLVITGSHMIIAMPIMVSFLTTHNPSELLIAPQLAALAQAGVCIGLGLKTKNPNQKRVALNVSPAGIFGITEPIIYGVTLPKGKPFILGCVAAGIVGLISGNLGIVTGGMGGMGLLAIPGLIPMDPNYQIPLYPHESMIFNLVGGTLLLFLSIILSGLFGYFLTSDYKSMQLKTKETNKLILKYLTINQKSGEIHLSNQELMIIKHKLKTIYNTANQKDKIKLSKEYENILVKIQKNEIAIVKIEAKETQIKQKLVKWSKIYTKIKNQKRLDNVINKFNSINNDQKKQVYIDKNIELDQIKNNILVEFNNNKNEFLAQVNEAIIEIQNDLNDDKIDSFKFNYQNASNAIDIYYDIVELEPKFVTEKRNIFKSGDLAWS